MTRGAAAGRAVQNWAGPGAAKPIGESRQSAELRALVVVPHLAAWLAQGFVPQPEKPACICGGEPCPACAAWRAPVRLAYLLGRPFHVELLQARLARLKGNVIAVSRRDGATFLGRTQLPEYRGSDPVLQERHYAHEQLPLPLRKG